MKSYEYAKLCLSRKKEGEELTHRFETRQTGEEFTEGEYGLMGVLDELGQRGWHAFNKTHKTVWFARLVPKPASGPQEMTEDEPFGGDIIPITHADERPLFAEPETEKKFYFSQFSLADGYKFLQLVHVTLQESSRIAAKLQLQNKKKYKQYLSGPLESKEEIKEEILLKSYTPERVIENFMKLDEDPHYRNMEGGK